MAEPELDNWNPWDQIDCRPFPLELAPKVIREYAEIRAEAVAVDVTAWVVSLVTAMAGILDQRVGIMPKQLEDYTVYVTMWTLIIGEPSTRKSRPIKEAGKFIREFDRRDVVLAKATQLLLEDEAKRLADFLTWDPKKPRKPSWLRRSFRASEDWSIYGRGAVHAALKSS